MSFTSFLNQVSSPGPTVLKDFRDKDPVVTLDRQKEVAGNQIRTILCQAKEVKQIIP